MAMSVKGLAAATMSHAHAVLREALEQAVKWQLLGRNPASHVDLPRRKPKKEIYAMSREEIEKFRASAKTSKWYPLFELLLATGLRPSEALALSWKQVDFTRESLSIVRKLSRRNKSDWKFDEPKSTKSRRVVTLPLAPLTRFFIIFHE